MLLLIGVVAAATAIAMTSQSLSLLTLSILLAAIVANSLNVPERCDAGITFGSRTLLRVGEVLLGLRLSVSDVASLGGTGLLGVIVVVLVTFFGAQLIARGSAWHRTSGSSRLGNCGLQLRLGADGALDGVAA